MKEGERTMTTSIGTSADTGRAATTRSCIAVVPASLSEP
jgi:hypothetical protein